MRAEVNVLMKRAGMKHEKLNLGQLKLCETEKMSCEVKVVWGKEAAFGKNATEYLSEGTKNYD